VPVEVASAGVAALVGYGIDGPSAQALAELGVDPSGHRARRLDDAMVAGADLVLGAAGSHRAAVVQASPLAFRRAFTLREFARLGQGLPPLGMPVTPEALVQRVGEVAARRGAVDPPAPGADEVADPFGASLDVARRSAQVVSEAVDGVVAALGLPVREPRMG
jgi:protein-tyrosine phosphatase